MGLQGEEPGGLRADVRAWLRRLARGEAKAVSSADLPGVGYSTGRYLRVAGMLFQIGMGGIVPGEAGAVEETFRLAGARIEERADAPDFFAGMQLRDRLYVNAAMPPAKRRRVIFQLYARYACWRDRGGPSASVYQERPGRDGYSRVAEYFQRIATAADPMQPVREPTLY